MSAKAVSQGVSRVARSRDVARLFPGWWTHIGAKGANRPFYRVPVSSDAELVLAKTLQPQCVRAEYAIVPRSAQAQDR